MSKKPVIVTVCGKGGVGKTSISALIVKSLSQDPSKRILAIDADPAVGLSFPLGIQVRKTVDDVRMDLIRRLDTGGSTSRQELIRSLDYELFHALAEKENIAFLAIGRSEADGCYCRINALLKDIIRQIAGNFDMVVIDAEAGIEQINRRVMEMVTHLLLVSDTSLKARSIAETIYRVALEKCSVEASGVVFNKIQDQSEFDLVCGKMSLPVWGYLPEDQMIRDFDREGRSFFDLPDNGINNRINSVIRACF
jgi:CO dehydrogenase maturation factor